MSTLKQEDFKIMDTQLANAAGKSISKVKVIEILHNKLKEVDLKNDFIVDRIEGAAIKDILDEINNL